MGAGAVRGQQTSEHQGSASNGVRHANQTRRSKSSLQANADGPTMACDSCNVSFTLFKRKKTCAECGRQHCSACLVKEAHRSSAQRRCSKCQLLSLGNFTRHDLQKLEVRYLRSFLARKGVNTVLCSEKNDLIELTLGFSNSSQHLREQRASQEHTAHLESRAGANANQPGPSRSQQRRRQHDAESQRRRQQRQESPQPRTPTPPQPSPSTVRQETEAERQARFQARREEEMRETENRLREELQTEEVDQRPRRKHASIDELKEEGDINDLTVRQLKEILTTNYVDYKGCVEKWELVSRVRRLWEESKQNREKFLETGEGVDSDESNMCKVCMDAVIDCVLLECGHMLTCTKCGRQLSECPICRQFVVRVVHTFRA